jgi:flavin-binding protein dodecin
MAIHKVIEVISQSKDSWEEAARDAVKDAAKTVKNIKAFDIKHMSAVVKGNKIVQYRINGNVTFEID